MVVFHSYVKLPEGIGNGGNGELRTTVVMVVSFRQGEPLKLEKWYPLVII